MLFYNTDTLLMFFISVCQYNCKNPSTNTNTCKKKTIKILTFIQFVGPACRKAAGHPSHFCNRSRPFQYYINESMAHIIPKVLCTNLCIMHKFNNFSIVNPTVFSWHCLVTLNNKFLLRFM